VTATQPQYGYINHDGKPQPLPKANMIHLCRFQEGMAAVEVRLPSDPSDGWGPQHWGFIDEHGNFAVSAIFQYAADFHDGLARVNIGGIPNGGADPIPQISMVDDWGRHFIYPVSGGKWGFVDKHGKLAIAPKYETASDFSEGLAFVSLGNECGYIDRSGEMVVRTASECIGSPFAEGLAEFSEKSKYGFMDVTGKHVIPARFYSAGMFSCGRAQVRMSKDGKAGYIDKSGTIVIQPNFDRASRFSEGLAAIHVGTKVGFIDASGKMVISPRFEMAFDFCEGLAPVRIAEHWGYVDKTGRVVIPARFVGAGQFRGGVARVAAAGRTFGVDDDRVDHATWGYIDKTGKSLISPQFDEALDFWEGKAVVSKYPKYGLKDAHDRAIVAPCYSRIGIFSEGLVSVFRNGRGGFLDPLTGRLSIPLEFDDLDGFSCGRAAAAQDQKWGFINKSGEFVVKPKYWIVSAFSEGLAAVDAGSNNESKSRCNWGYIDTKGKMVIEPTFGSAGNFSEGLASVSRYSAKAGGLDKEGYIDKNGTMVIEPRFYLAFDFHEGLARVAVRPEKALRKEQGDEEPEPEKKQPDDKWGFIDKTGKFVIEPRYSWADDFSNGRATVFDGKKEYKIDPKGRLYPVEKKRE